MGYQKVGGFFISKVSKALRKFCCLLGRRNQEETNLILRDSSARTRVAAPFFFNKYDSWSDCIKGTRQAKSLLKMINKKLLAEGAVSFSSI